MVRCKFIVSSKTEVSTGNDPKTGAPIPGWEVKLAAVWEGADAKGENIAQENHIFSKATPSGEHRMFISNKVAADQFVPGHCYYVDYTLAGVPAYAKPKT
jgi:hypothetical protein